jgi:hypothetical protein
MPSRERLINAYLKAIEVPSSLTVKAQKTIEAWDNAQLAHKFKKANQRRRRAKAFLRTQIMT